MSSLLFHLGPFLPRDPKIFMGNYLAPKPYKQLHLVPMNLFWTIQPHIVPNTIPRIWKPCPHEENCTFKNVGSVQVSHFGTVLQMSLIFGLKWHYTPSLMPVCAFFLKVVKKLFFRTQESKKHQKVQKIQIKLSYSGGGFHIRAQNAPVLELKHSHGVLSTWSQR